MTSSLQSGINAAKAGRMQEALEHLKDAIIEEPQNAEVWVWIAAIIDDTEKQSIFLEKALEIDPHNIPAQRGLAYLEKRKQDETSVKEDHLSDHTRPISPFPKGEKRKPPIQPLQWSKHTVDELEVIAEAGDKKPKARKLSKEDPENSEKLSPFEIVLLGIVALVFCFIGLLAASAIFNFDLPLATILGDRATLTSAPPYQGVFLYEDEMFFDIQQYEGLPTTNVGIPISRRTMPLIVLYESIADRNQMKLIYETGEYIPIRGKRGPGNTELIQPEQDLELGLYCFQQFDQTDTSKDAYYWCFLVHEKPRIH
jgi:tetratricopeptide (TPR) repeat protein